MKCLIVTSPTTDINTSQTSVFYLATRLEKLGYEYDILDISGSINYYDPPSNIYGKPNIKLWLSDKVFYEDWIDNYIPNITNIHYDIILCSALFSHDIILQGRYIFKYKNMNNNCKAIIGGAALQNLSEEQTKIIYTVFDEICTSQILCEPDYNLFNIKNFITVASGYGCDWGKCKFCNSGKQKYFLRDKFDIAKDFVDISKLSNAEIMLSSDSIPIDNMLSIANYLRFVNNKQKYNIMSRADKKINSHFASVLYESGCTDVFIGVEIFNNKGLKMINKGTSVYIIKESLKNLSTNGIKVPIGLIAFLPCVSQRQLDNQLLNIEKALPYINTIELETLSVLYNSEFYTNHCKYGIELFPKENLIFDYWCYGLSHDIPWTFKNKNEIKMWFNYLDKLKEIASDYISEQYWWGIDYIKEKCEI